jgi:hypothetical protein
VTAKVFDFVAISSKLAPVGEMRDNFNSLRSAYGTFSQRLAALPETPAPVDFAAYEAKLTSNFKKTVPQLKGLYADILADVKADFPNGSKQPAEFDEQDALMLELFNKHIAMQKQASVDRLAKMEAELAGLLSAVPINEMTTSEFLKDKAEAKVQYEQEIKDGSFV